MLYPEQLAHTAQRLLQAVQKGFADAGVPLPDRQFLYAGAQPPADFDSQDADQPGLLAVGIGPLIPGQPGAMVSGAVMAQRTEHSGQLLVWIMRAVHTVTQQQQLPTPDDMTADAVTVMTDTAILLGALENARRDHAVVGRNVAYSVGQVTPVTALGGYAGVSASITVDLIDPGSG